MEEGFEQQLELLPKTSLTSVPFNLRHREDDPLYFWVWLALAGLNFVVGLLSLWVGLQHWSECALPFPTFLVISGSSACLLSLFKVIHLLSARICWYGEGTWNHYCLDYLRLSFGIVLELAMAAYGIVLLSLYGAKWSAQLPSPSPFACPSLVVHWTWSIVILSLVTPILLTCCGGCLVAAYIGSFLWEIQKKYQSM